MYQFLLKSRSIPALSLLTCIITGIFCTLLLSSIGFSFNGYLNNISPDVSQHLSGWYAFVHEPWHLPLLNIYLLNYPIGTTISLTDSIPLFALFFKAIRVILPPEFNYFGIFIIVNYFVQAFAALTLSIALNRKNFIATIGFVLFAISAPPLSIFVGFEEALTFQGLIILAISGYFFIYYHNLKLIGMHYFYGILLCISLLIHPYLTAMIYPFYLLGLWLLYKQNALPKKYCIIYFISLHLIILLEFIIFGLGTGANSTFGFGKQAMNLIQPFSGGRFTLVMARKNLYPDFTENVAYLGLGLMLAIIFALLMKGKTLKKTFINHQALFGVTFMLFIIAIYGRVWFDSYHLFDLKAPEFILTDAFRINERFIWPAWYLLLAFAVYVLSKDWQKKSMMFFIPIFLAIQLMDVSNYLHGLRQNLKTNFLLRTFAAPYHTMFYGLLTSSKPVPDYEAVRQLIRESKIVIFYPDPIKPPYAPSKYNLSRQALGEIQLDAAIEGVPINNAYIAHYIKLHTKDAANDFDNLNPKLLVSPIYKVSPTIKHLLLIHPQDCHLWNNIYYCRYVHKRQKVIDKRTPQ